MMVVVDKIVPDMLEDCKTGEVGIPETLDNSEDPVPEISVMTPDDEGQGDASILAAVANNENEELGIISETVTIDGEDDCSICDTLDDGLDNLLVAVVLIMVDDCVARHGLKGFLNSLFDGAVLDVAVHEQIFAKQNRDHPPSGS